MHRRGTALNNVLCWQRCKTVFGEHARPTESQRQRPKPDQPHTAPRSGFGLTEVDRSTLSADRFSGGGRDASLGAGAELYGTSDDHQLWHAGGRTGCTTCLAGDWRPLTSDTVFSACVAAGHPAALTAYSFCIAQGYCCTSSGQGISRVMRSFRKWPQGSRALLLRNGNNALALADKVID